MPEVILHDNLKTAVLSRGAGGKVQWNPRNLDFALAYGFTPQPGKPYRAQTKGKIERSIRSVRQNFWVGTAFVDLDDVNGQMRHWLATVANCDSRRKRFHLCFELPLNRVKECNDLFLKP